VRVLIADDEGTTRLKLEGLLRKLGHEVLSAADGAEALEILQREDAPTLAILDWIMPGLDGVEVCRKLREAGRRPYIYLIRLTIKDQAQDVVVGMEAGADDYLSKPFDIDELRVRVLAGERILALQDELREQATHDDLTKVLNRRAILQTAERELAHATRADEGAAVVLIDLDEFKSVNDLYGHPVGDAVLREAASRLGARMRSYDEIGRYGGEEFLVVLPGCGAARALDVAERMRQLVGDQPIQTDRGPVSITASFGVAVTRAGQAHNVEQLIVSADEALYRAKRGGRNRVEGPPQGFCPAEPPWSDG
jgi:diguanylate cyclase (GGDEF)-like protein